MNEILLINDLQKYISSVSINQISQFDNVFYKLKSIVITHRKCFMIGEESLIIETMKNELEKRFYTNEKDIYKYYKSFIINVRMFIYDSNGISGSDFYDTSNINCMKLYEIKQLLYNHDFLEELMYEEILINKPNFEQNKHLCFNKQTYELLIDLYKTNQVKEYILPPIFLEKEFNFDIDHIFSY